MLIYQQPLHIHEAQKTPSSGNNPTLLKTPDFKGFYSSRFAIDSNMTAKNQDALLFTAEHLFCYCFGERAVAELSATALMLIGVVFC